MPGLAALRDSAGKIVVDYATTAAGARVTYTTTDTALGAALHAWANPGQDHGDHATHDSAPQGRYRAGTDADGRARCPAATAARPG
jgi:hypothetical protein